MITLDIPLLQIQMFLLVFLRLGAILVFMPIFDSRSIPVLFKAGLALAMSVMLFPLLQLETVPLFSNFLSFGIGVVGEIMLGAIIGFSVKILFAGIQMAGQLAGYQMGLAIANVMDPATSEQVPLLAMVNNLMALLIFLAINAHHWFILAIQQSYVLVPPFGFEFSSSLMQLLITLSGNIFILAIKIGAPVIVALLLTSIGFGLIARTVPQMNVFIVAMPLKIGVGLLFFGLSFPYVSMFFKSMFGGMANTVIILLKAMT